MHWGSDKTNRPESFLIMLRREYTTPNTSLASSSNGSAVEDADAAGCASVAAVWSSGGGGDAARLSCTATTTPETDESVLRGLLNAEPPAPPSAGADAAPIARETAGRSPPSAAGRGRRVRCQSW
jgi:hypothetical protein